MTQSTQAQHPGTGPDRGPAQAQREAAAGWSLALRDFAPDYADTSIIALPAGAPTDPAQWARTVFGIRSMPVWIRGALLLRQVLAPLIGVARAPRDTFAVDEIRTDPAGRGEALISADDAHLDFRCGIAVDAAAGLVRVTTNVRLHNRRGRLYFLPVRALHPIVVDSMLRRAARNLAPA
ncbi:DUF2867 domain-containing protein [Cellulomonas composti]|uniref:DUF2867 domain-containing protein n=1 Tax=Cellulomonas composti TaxID=266130 RepID=A0A511JDA4_9CELL|nr:DUF2867 domain-containing protein [Cellulomonas composti]GEL95952.1 hypothetical protein CCO02nite_26100 [Cellulomonas composti]